jgi:hypothetical protein
MPTVGQSASNSNTPSLGISVSSQQKNTIQPAVVTNPQSSTA